MLRNMTTLVIVYWISVSCSGGQMLPLLPSTCPISQLICTKHFNPRPCIPAMEHTQSKHSVINDQPCRILFIRSVDYLDQSGEKQLVFRRKTALTFFINTLHTRVTKDNFHQVPSPSTETGQITTCQIQTYPEQRVRSSGTLELWCCRKTLIEPKDYVTHWLG